MPAHYESKYPYDPSGRMPIPKAALPDPLIWLTWAAAATTRLGVGTAILILPQHNPVVLAKAVASLDRLSGGRAMLGVGLGWLREEADAVGVRFEDRAGRADEYIEAMRALWTQPVASFSGQHVRFENVRCNPMPARAGGVPIHIGGHSPAAARRAGRLGDGFMPLRGSLEDLPQLRKRMEESAREAGRDPADIEITFSGGADLETARRYADAGVTRMIVHCVEPDLERTKRTLGPFSDAAIGGRL